MNLSEAIEQFLLEPRAATTEESYRRTLRQMVKHLGPDCDIASVTQSDIVAWHRAMKQQKSRYVGHRNRPVEDGGLSPHTINKRLKTARIFFNWCVNQAKIPSSPMEGHKKETAPKPEVSARTLSAEDLVSLTGVMLKKPLDRAMFCFFLDTACRAGALARLTLSALDLDSCTARLSEKGGKKHILPFSNLTETAIRAWLEVRPPVKDRHVFLNQDGNPWNSDSLRSWLRRRSQKAKIALVSPHDLRRTASCCLSINGVPLSLVQMLLGHSDPAITLRYYMPDNQALLRGMIEKSGVLQSLSDLLLSV